MFGGKGPAGGVWDMGSISFPPTVKERTVFIIYTMDGTFTVTSHEVAAAAVALVGAAITKEL